jgi:hypothetical protein
VRERGFGFGIKLYRCCCASRLRCASGDAALSGVQLCFGAASGVQSRNLELSSLSTQNTR